MGNFAESWDTRSVLRLKPESGRDAERLSARPGGGRAGALRSYRRAATVTETPLSDKCGYATKYSERAGDVPAVGLRPTRMKALIVIL
jgi:hypothetical protein